MNAQFNEEIKKFFDSNFEINQKNLEDFFNRIHNLEADLKNFKPFLNVRKLNEYWCCCRG